LAEKKLAALVHEQSQSILKACYMEKEKKFSFPIFDFKLLSETLQKQIIFKACEDDGIEPEKIDIERIEDTVFCELYF
jgi:hypothetical protein